MSAVTSKKPESEIFSNHSNKQEDGDIITITEKINLKKRQYKVLKIICDTYSLSISEYIQEVLIEAMKSGI
jgi:DNA-binding winged helix-turn-helix (wHTH) protein